MSELRLSEAIRRGAMLKPQAFGVTESEGGGTCALGGALEAIGITGRRYSAASEYWPIAGAVVANPVRDDYHLLFGVIRELNDSHKWTREQIADWVETIEAQHETPQPEAVSCEA